MNAPSPGLSIIVPVFREAENLRPLIDRIFAATRGSGLTAEVIIVDDDSRDGTEEIVAELARGLPVVCIVRQGQRGLGSAVLEGFRHARSDLFVVMDADLQHPPEWVPRLAQPLQDPDVEFVMASRYMQGGRIAGEWSRRRRLASRLAGWLARPLACVSDPMSGFFALRRRVWVRARNIHPIGYKIALELYVKGRCGRVVEVPFEFQTRLRGESKFSLAEQWRYARHLGRLYRFKYPRACLAVAAGTMVLIAAALAAWWT